MRDILLGLRPKDYDIATAARPQQVKRTFPRNCRIIGRRFKLAHLHFHENTKILEVSTFRRSPQAENPEDDLLIRHDNEFGTAEEDALRRDFTVNALFLDPGRDQILDYANGLEDLRHRTIRTIGEPIVRFREDPVRILRAAKFAGRLGFQVEPQTLAAMAEVAPDLVRAAPPRLLEEILRLLRGGHALDSFQLLRDVGALKSLLPIVANFLGAAPQPQRVTFWRILEALDHSVHEGVVPPNPVLLGTLFACPVQALAERQTNRSPSSIAEELLGPLSQTLRLPRRDAGCLKRICGVQHRFLQAQEQQRFKIQGFVHGPYFAEALELFALRAHATGIDDAIVTDWRDQARKAGPARGDYDADYGSDDEPEGQPHPGARRPPDAIADTAVRDVVEADDADEGGSEDQARPAEDRAAGADQGEGSRRRRRRRRRGGRGRGSDAAQRDDRHPAAAEPAEADAHGMAETEPVDDAERDVPPWQADDVVAGHGDEAEPGSDEAGEGDGALGDEGSDDLAVVEGDAGAAPGERRGRRRRRRRRRGGNRDGSEGGAEGGAPGPDGPGRSPEARAPHGQQPRQQGQGQRQPQHQQPQQQGGGDREGGGRNRRRGGRDRDRDRGRRDRSLPRDVDVVPRGRDRRGKVDVLEPKQLDLTAFDIELDPKRVPTFGSIVEGKGRPKRKSPRLPDDGKDDYKPPPPPGQDSGPGGAPPPPPDSDVFGDW